MNTAPIDLKLEVVVIPVSDVDRASASTKAWGGGWTPISTVAQLAGGADDTSRLTVLHPFRQGASRRRHRARPESVSRGV
jgi:hypothetical protein